MAALEKHYTVSELSALWQLSTDSIRRIFRGRADVLKLASPEKLRKRGYVVLRIPESVAQKVHAELRAKAA